MGPGHSHSSSDDMGPAHGPGHHGPGLMDHGPGHHGPGLMDHGPGHHGPMDHGPGHHDPVCQHSSCASCMADDMCLYSSEGGCTDAYYADPSAAGLVMSASECPVVESLLARLVDNLEREARRGCCYWQTGACCVSSCRHKCTGR